MLVIAGIMYCTTALCPRSDIVIFGHIKCIC